MILATYNCFQIPVEVAFEPDILKAASMRALAYIIDFLFFVDIIVAFRTTFINSINGNEVTNTREIAYNYLQS